jgi:hypothetical protein
MGAMPAKAVLPKPAFGADRRVPANHKSKSPDRKNSAQEKYGNNEVARVLALKRPAWVEDKDGIASLKELPEAGPLVTTGSKYSPVATLKDGKAAPDPKGKTDKGKPEGKEKGASKADGTVAPAEGTDKDDKSGEKQKGAGKGNEGKKDGPTDKAVGAGVEKKESGKAQDESGADDEGSSGMGAESHGAAGLAVAFDDLPAAAAPRFEGTDAVVVSTPTLDGQQRDRVRSQTGLTITEHYARIKVDLDRLSARARSEQFAIVQHIELLRAEVSRDVENQASMLPGLTSAAIDKVRGACNQARGSLNAASEAALKTIKDKATLADKNVDAKSLDSKDAIANAVLALSPKIQALHEETMAPLRKVLKDTAKALGIVGTAFGEAVVKKADGLAKNLNERSGTPIEIAQFERQGIAAQGKATRMQADFIEAGKLGGEGILKLEPTFSLTFLQLVNPVAVTDLPMAGEAQCKKVEDQTATVKLRLTSDYERAIKFVEMSRERALKGLDSLQTSAVQQLTQLGAQLEATARTRGERLDKALLAGEAPAAEAWARQMEQANALVQSGEILDWRVLSPRMRDAAASMDALSWSQRAAFDQQARDAIDETNAALGGDRQSLDQASDASLDGVKTAYEHEDALRLAAKHFENGFRGVAVPACSQIGNFRTAAEEKLGASADITRKQMEKVRAGVAKSLDVQVVEFEGRLNEPLKNFEAGLAEAFARIANDLIVAQPDGIAARVGRAERAMDKVGTDESGLFDALRGMTAKLGAAVEYHWDQVHPGWHTLRWWLDDELSGSEKKAAFAYLDGNRVEGAKHEIAAAKGWFKTDGSQVESALRGLNADDLTNIKKDEKFIGDLRGQLKGTDLNVANALLAGRVARADALRIKEKIDDAKFYGKDDKMHDALGSIHPDRLAEVRNELADVIKGNAMAEKPPAIAEADALKEVTDYIKAPVKGFDPNAIGYVRTRTLSKSSEDLAIALIAKGEGSNEARANRLAFETQRSGGPRQERMAKALDDRELVEARAAVEALPKDAPKEDVDKAKERAAKAEANRTEMLTQFAKATGATEDVLKDPKQVQAFAEQTVGDAYAKSETVFGGFFGTDPLAKKLAVSMVRDGRADPATAIAYAIKGAGTNEALIRRTLQGMPRAEIDKLIKSYAKDYGNGNQDALFNDLGVFQDEASAKAAGVKAASGGGFFTELSGDDKHDVEELLLGTPENDRDQWRLARLKAEHQRGEGSEFTRNVVAPAIGNALVPGMGIEIRDQIFNSGSGQALDYNRRKMEEMVAAGGGPEKAFDEKGNIKPIPGKFTLNDFRMHTAGTREASESYKAHIDNIAGLVTGAIALIGAIVGTIVVTVLTLGTATPFVIGAWAAGIAAVTGAAAIAANYAIKGNRYGWEDVALDGAITLLDAATAGLTAGAGAAAARVAQAEIAAAKAAARTSAQIAAAEGVAKQQAKKQVVGGFVRAAKSAGASGAGHTALTDGTWDEGILTGLGRTLAGGAKAATIGVASHGAGHGFNTTIGKGLAQSTSYVGRSLGTGLSGAVGGMAGRSTELTLDALGGHSQGSFEDNLLSVVSAGGRGFVENVGQGIAEVPKARRDAAQERYQRKAFLDDEARVARSGTSRVDDESDAAFRMKALRAARAVDPKVNPREFLDKLDAAVAKDRSDAAKYRELARKFRTEALAGIPPARRGEFADTPIRVIDDADFERLTGSKSGQAVTRIFDGEAQIVVRKSATPETLREEGIHVLQSRDPKWRDKVALLDEKTMSRWNELDLETQLKLYKNKIEIEIDAQQKLRTNLIEDAERAPDPARRHRLLERVDEAGETLKSLQSRQLEVEAIGPDRIAAIRRGNEARPQYLREPPRLFTKVQTATAKPKPQPQPKTKSKSKKAPLDAELRPEDASYTRKLPIEDGDDLSGESKVDAAKKNTTWGEKYKDEKFRIVQRGDAWQETETYYTRNGNERKRERWYRFVEVYEKTEQGEKLVGWRGEILQRKGNKRWQQRGSVSTEEGAEFEEASRLRTLGKLRQALGRNVLPNEDMYVPIGALVDLTKSSRPALSAQHGGGAGFDNVVFRFRRVNGELVAEIIIIEAKKYNRALTLADFSAITTNLSHNLEQLSKAVVRSDFSEERIEAVRAAIREQRLQFEIHTSPTTKVGDIRSERATILQTIVDTEKGLRHLAEMRRRFAEIREEDALSYPEKLQLQKDKDAIDRLETRLKRAYKRNPLDSAEVRTVLTAMLEGTKDVNSVAVIAARNNLTVSDRETRIRQKQLKINRGGIDEPYMDAAKASIAQRRQAAGTEEVVRLELVDRDSRPLAQASIAPPDLTVVKSPTTQKAAAITAPGVTTPSASDQVIKLLREGAPLANGKTQSLDRVILDTAGADLPTVAAALERVRLSLEPTPVDARRFRVTIDGTVTASQEALLKDLGLSAGVHVEQGTRTPPGTPTWILSFDPAWVTKTK